MFDFNKVLTENEEIIYKAQPVAGKGDKSIKGPIFGILFIFVCQLLLVLSLVFKIGDGENGINLSFIIIFAVTLLFDGILLYSIIYNLFIKQKSVSDDYFCITNKRVLKYQDRKQELQFGYLYYYASIEISNEKDGFGDITFTSNQIEEEEILSIMFKPNKENMPSITFESVANPKEVVDIARKARKDLISNENN